MPYCACGNAVAGWPANVTVTLLCPNHLWALLSQSIAACVAQNPRFIELDLADNSDGASSLHIDLLIGSDYYWDRVTGGFAVGTGG